MKCYVNVLVILAATLWPQIAAHIHCNLTSVSSSVMKTKENLIRYKNELQNISHTTQKLKDYIDPLIMRPQVDIIRQIEDASECPGICLGELQNDLASPDTLYSQQFGPCIAKESQLEPTESILKTLSSLIDKGANIEREIASMREVLWCPYFLEKIGQDSNRFHNADVKIQDDMEMLYQRKVANTIQCAKWNSTVAAMKLKAEKCLERTSESLCNRL